MTPQSGGSGPKKNCLLANLAPQDYDALMGQAKVVPLKFHKRLLRQDERIEAIYFPITSMISMLVTTNDEPHMEMATIGREGVIGAVETVQSQGAIGMYIIQIPGTAVRIEATQFRELADGRPKLMPLLYRHQSALMRQVLQGAACNRLHTMEERCARWLLMTHDRAERDTFPITQEFLAHMLGVRRASVNLATGMLKRAGFIHYVRGQLTVADRKGLESASCQCYRAIVKVYKSAIPNGAGPGCFP